jgi:hypothetical protein
MVEGPGFWDPGEGLAQRLGYCAFPPQEGRYTGESVLIRLHGLIFISDLLT